MDNYYTTCSVELRRLGLKDELDVALKLLQTFNGGVEGLVCGLSYTEVPAQPGCYAIPAEVRLLVANRLGYHTAATVPERKVVALLQSNVGTHLTTKAQRKPEKVEPEYTYYEPLIPAQEYFYPPQWPADK